jgi:hypothetical protein
MHSAAAQKYNERSNDKAHDGSLLQLVVHHHVEGGAKVEPVTVETRVSALHFLHKTASISVIETMLGNIKR